MKFQLGQWVKLSPEYPTPARQGEVVVVLRVFDEGSPFAYEVTSRRHGWMLVHEVELEEILQ